MKRYTTAKAIAVLSKPGREGWYAIANRDSRFNQEKITPKFEWLEFEFKALGRDWETRARVNKRSDWQIIKPKREKLRRIGTTKALFSLECEIRKLGGSAYDYEIFARRVGK